MYKELKYSGGKIAYDITGEGYPVVLLHGYLESMYAWDDFTEELAKDFTVIVIDLPGHGSTSVFSDTHSMTFMAKTVLAVLDAEQIDKCFMVGHSMGGYVTMEFLNNFPDRLDGFCLFHSTPFADNEEKKQIRDRIIQAIEAGKFVSLAKEHVEKTFAAENLSEFILKVGYLKIIAVNTKPAGAIAALKGMKNRKDHTKLIEQTTIPGLWILGEKDNFIDSNIYKNLRLSEKIKIKKLKKSGHQGYIEQKADSLLLLKDFIKDEILKK